MKGLSNEGYNEASDAQGWGYANYICSLPSLQELMTNSRPIKRGQICEAYSGFICETVVNLEGERRNTEE